MKRVGDLWSSLTSFEYLLAAAENAARGKKRRPDVAAFVMNLEWEVLQLRRELLDGSYEAGPYRTFAIEDPKPRQISAAPFRDRVVHHALTQVLEPVFERRFSKDSFACRKGLGTHKALARAREGARRYKYVLKCDIRKYFASIDHQILKGTLAPGFLIASPPLGDLRASAVNASPLAAFTAAGTTPPAAGRRRRTCRRRRGTSRAR